MNSMYPDETYLQVSLMDINKRNHSPLSSTSGRSNLPQNMNAFPFNQNILLNRKNGQGPIDIHGKPPIFSQKESPSYMNQSFFPAPSMSQAKGALIKPSNRNIPTRTQSEFSVRDGVKINQLSSGMSLNDFLQASSMMNISNNKTCGDPFDISPLNSQDKTPLVSAREAQRLSVSPFDKNLELSTGHFSSRTPVKVVPASPIKIQKPLHLIQQSQSPNSQLSNVIRVHTQGSPIIGDRLILRKKFNHSMTHNFKPVSRTPMRLGGRLNSCSQQLNRLGSQDWSCMAPQDWSRMTSLRIPIEEEEDSQPIPCVNCGQRVMTSEVDSHTLRCLIYKGFAENTINDLGKFKKEQERIDNEIKLRASMALRKTQASRVIQGDPGLLGLCHKLFELGGEAANTKKGKELKGIGKKLREMSGSVGHIKKPEVNWMVEEMKGMLRLVKQKHRSVLQEMEAELELSLVDESDEDKPFYEKLVCSPQVKKEDFLLSLDQTVNDGFMPAHQDIQNLSKELFKRSFIHNDPFLYESPVISPKISGNQNAIEREGFKKEFYSMVIREKLKLPINHPKKNQDIAHMFALVVNKEIPKESWLEFISCCLDD